MKIAFWTSSGLAEAVSNGTLPPQSCGIDPPACECQPSPAAPERMMEYCLDETLPQNDIARPVWADVQMLDFRPLLQRRTEHKKRLVARRSTSRKSL
jgi:hypothetical protein